MHLSNSLFYGGARVGWSPSPPVHFLSKGLKNCGKNTATFFPSGLPCLQKPCTIFLCVCKRNPPFLEASWNGYINGLLECCELRGKISENTILLFRKCLFHKFLMPNGLENKWRVFCCCFSRAFFYPRKFSSPSKGLLAWPLFYWRCFRTNWSF